MRMKTAMGSLRSSWAGILPVKKITGPETDRGELQRYLGSVVFCPSMMLNHPTLEWKEVGSNIYQLRDRLDLTGATIDLEVSETGPACGGPRTSASDSRQPSRAYAVVRNRA